MKRAALRKAIPPHWFSGTLVLLSGLLVTLSAADLRQYHVLIILMIGSVILYQVQKAGVVVKNFPIKHIKQLENVGYVKQRKSKRNGRQRTWIYLTELGTNAFEAHVEELKRLTSFTSADK